MKILYTLQHVNFRNCYTLIQCLKSSDKKVNIYSYNLLFFSFNGKSLIQKTNFVAGLNSLRLMEPELITCVL